MQKYNDISRKTDIKCPKCGGAIVVKRSKKDRRFYGCSNFLECNFFLCDEHINTKCRACGSILTKSKSKKI